MTLWIAFDYGGRAEIVEAARRLVEEGVDPRDVDENAIASRLYAPDMPEPDLLIRTSGEQRTLELPALAGRVRGARLRRRPLARLRRAASSAAPLEEYATRRGASAADEQRLSRLLVVAAGLPIVLGAAWLGGWCDARARRGRGAPGARRALPVRARSSGR